MTSLCRRARGIKLGLACARDFILGGSKINCKLMLTTTLGRDCIKSLFFFFLPRGGKFTEESTCHTVMARKCE